MDLIQILPKQIANQIAAGEVVQRPSSAVKELIENAIDAGASNIELHIKDAGKTLIQVVDNGCGMSIKDVKLCHHRHSTSKIKKINDLFQIKTMGFRGEALASIASISMLEIKTKIKKNKLGTKISIQDGKITGEEECVCSSGTTIKVKNLFYNVPARRRFLKSNNVEMRHITDAFIRISLANPEIEMHLFHNKKKTFSLQKTNFRQRITNIIGTRKNEILVPIKETTTLVAINGFIGKPESAKRTRGEQYFFVNGRFIKNHYLNHAIQKGFSELIPEKYYPSYFINLKIEPELIDVNIHPTKTEIKFENEQEIYAILRATVRKSLGEYNIAPSINFSQEIAFESSFKKQKASIIKEPKIRIDTHYNPFEVKSIKIDEVKETKQQLFSLDKIKKTNISKLIQISNKFILYSDDNGLNIIHQRRAHKRILFEHFITLLKKQKLPSQKLLFNKKIYFIKKDLDIITTIKEKLYNIGFEFEIINNEEVSITGIPNEFQEKNIENILEKIIELYKKREATDIIINKQIAKSLSENLAIHTKRHMNIEEMKKLKENLLACENPFTCPLGEKIIIKITNIDIENNF